MIICGYHLRCANYKHKCLECGRQQKDKNSDYLDDRLNIWPKGKEAVCMIEPALL